MTDVAREDDFAALRRHVRSSYAGFQDKVAGREDELTRLTEELEDRIRRDAAGENRSPVIDRVLREWLEFFGDRHMQALPRSNFERGAALSAAPEFAPSLTRLDARSLLLGMPTCDPPRVEEMRALLESHDAELRSNPVLLIDVRGGGGGTDTSWYGILPFLYTDPYLEVGCDFWASEENAAYVAELAASRSLDGGASAALGNLALRMRSQPNAFVSWVSDREIRFDEVLPFPERVGVLIDRRTASAKEAFVLAARQSRKVTIFGENSRGSLDYSNQRRIDLPSGERILMLPMSRSRRLPGDPVDLHGIAPDVRISGPAEDVVAFVVKYFATAT